MTDFENKYGQMTLTFPDAYDQDLHADVHFDLEKYTSGNVDHLYLIFSLVKNEKYSTQLAEKMCSYFMPSDKKLVIAKKEGFKNSYVTWDYGAIFHSDWLASQITDQKAYATYNDGATEILQYNPSGTFYLLTRPLTNNRGFCVIETGVVRELVNK